ncbi:Major Facilitator Superfamily [Bifidobacterium ramosum]|uniref:MFS transporter n=1 Tax=Bifidobacterium ramosum TaxID=1798158 RepID=A0A6L4X2A6_9BIFI|nr:MFS transporter [Bifidobacterium ramosum]KAB8288720.1 Major Facilitator Superfamily [Bifidobacterium ramosum]NEG71416.1 MFS transporter [Bifidobacterium ramosum]
MNDVNASNSNAIDDTDVQPADETPITAATNTTATISSARTTHTSLWHNPQYRSWFTADTASATGLALKSFAISLVAFSLTRSLPTAGWLATASVIAAQISGVFGGTLADRHNRKRLIILNAACGTVLWGTVCAMLATGLLTFPVFAVAIVTASTVNGLLGNATNAMLRSIIPTADYPKAQSLNQGRDSVISLAGSPLGGMLYAFSAWAPFAAASLMYAVAGVSASMLRVDEHARNAIGRDSTDDDITGGMSSRHGSFIDDFVEGWRWMLRRRTLMAICVIAALLNFGINGIFATVQLQLVGSGVDSVRIGFVDMATGAGMLAGAVIAARVCDRMAVGTGLIVMSLAALATMTPMLVSRAYPVILVSSLLCCLPIPTLNSLVLGFVFAKVPTDMQGRVDSSSNLLGMLPTLFCSAIAGSLLPTIGFRMTVALFLTALAANVTIVLAMPAVRSIPAADRWDEAEL